MRVLMLSVLSAVAVSPAASAIVPPLYVGVTGGSLGVGPEIGYTFNPFVGVRASATFLGFDVHDSSGGYRYSAKVHINNWGGTVDVYPLAGFAGFRLSAGARETSHNRIRFSGSATGNRTYSGQTFTPDQIGNLNGTVYTKSVSPLLTVGYVRRLAGFSFGIDGGVMFHGTPRPEDFSATGQLGTNPNAQSDYLAQQQRVRNDVDAYKYYPVLQLSLGYRF